MALHYAAALPLSPFSVAFPPAPPIILVESEESETKQWELQYHHLLTRIYLIDYNFQRTHTTCKLQFMSLDYLAVENVPTLPSTGSHGGQVKGFTPGKIEDNTQKHACSRLWMQSNSKGTHGTHATVVHGFTWSVPASQWQRWTSQALDTAM